ncbi:MAG: tetratricopeptide repeat protein [Thermoanaerobaculia bacterium]
MSDSSLTLCSPAAALHVLGEGSAREAVRELLVEYGAFPTGDGTFTFRLRPGDPAVFDTALSGGARLLNEAAASSQREREGLRLLVSPAEATLEGDAVRAATIELAEDLRTSPPALEGGTIHLTSHSARMLEDTWRLSAGRPYRRPSGKEVPLLRAEGPGERRSPWRNPTLLERPTVWVERPEVEERLLDRVDEPALLLMGPLGSGKTRLAHRVLDRRGLQQLTVRAGSDPNREGLVWQIARQLLLPVSEKKGGGVARFRSPGTRREAADRWHAARTDTARREAILTMLRSLIQEQGEPLYLLCDDAERLGEGDLALLSDLAGEAGADNLRLWIVARPEQRLADSLGGLCQLRTGLLDEAEHRRLAEQLTSGWALPEGVLATLVEETSGNPFALEEALIAMARCKHLRRSYGSFSYAGPNDSRPCASQRWTAHMQSEAGRLGLLEPLLTMAVAEGPLPVAAVRAGLPSPPIEGWEEIGLRAGLLRRSGSPWGLGLELACPAYGLGLAAVLDAKTRAAIRLRLGTKLAEGEPSGGNWRIYRMLRGTAEGVPALLRSTREKDRSQAPRDPELLAALQEELAALRARGEDGDAELVLLWRLFQVARRVGRVAEHLDDLTRALSLSRQRPERYLALAHLKAEVEHEAGRHRDAERTLLGALELTDGHASAARRAPLMLRLARLYMDAGQLSDAERLLEVYPAMQREGLAAAAASCRFPLGNIARRAHLYPQALAHHGAALETRRRLELGLDSSASLCALGTVAATMGNYPRALAYYEEAEKVLAHEPDSDRDLSFALLGRARVLGRLGDFTAATPLLRRAMSLREHRDDKPAEAIARLALATNLLDLGRREQAFEQAGRARFQLEMLGVVPVLADADQLLGRIQLERRHLTEAEQHLASATGGHRKQEDEAAYAFDLAWLIQVGRESDHLNTVDRTVRELQTVRARLARVEMAEVLDHRLFQGLEWLADRGMDLDDARPYLQRAYEQLLAKAGHLRPEHRHRFLYDVPDNREIVEAATRLDLAL